MTPPWGHAKYRRNGLTGVREFIVSSCSVVHCAQSEWTSYFRRIRKNPLLRESWHHNQKRTDEQNKNFHTSNLNQCLPMSTRPQSVPEHWRALRTPLRLNDFALTFQFGQSFHRSVQRYHRIGNM